MVTTRKIDALETLSRKKMKVPPALARTAKKEAQRVLSKVIKFTRTGAPINSVDKAILQQIKKKDSQIKKEIKSLLAKGKPKPSDYYKIYHRVLKESGLISAGQLDPRILRKLRSDCGWCNACSACRACTFCIVSATAALGATGAIAGHASTAF